MAAIQKITPEVGVKASPFIAYYRVSTQRQGASGLGLEAQEAAVATYIRQQGGILIQSFKEVESGKNDARPALAEALSACRAMKAVLVIAKLDRLARNAEFLLRIVRESGEGGVAFCDLPRLPPGPMGKFIIGLLAGVGVGSGTDLGAHQGGVAGGEGARCAVGQSAFKARHQGDDRAGQRGAISQGGCQGQGVLPYIERARKAGATSLGEIAEALNNLGVKAPRGGQWLPTSVSRAIARAEAKPVTLAMAA
jgi:hypothetical protein